MPVLHCPRCDKRLTVSDWAPRVLTCPDCLSRVPNPGGIEPHATHPPPLPRRVIPIEQQVDFDARATSYTLFGLSAVFGLAAYLTFVTSLRNHAIVLAVVTLVVLATAVLQARYPESESVQTASRVVSFFATGFVKIVLILIGLILLLAGTCAVIFMQSGFRG